LEKRKENVHQSSPCAPAQGVDFDFFLGQKVSLLVPPKRIIDNETQHALIAAPAF